MQAQHECVFTPDVQAPIHAPSQSPSLGSTRVNIPAPNLMFDDLYIGAIPQSMRPIFDSFGIKFVLVRHTVSGNTFPTDYYIYAQNLNQVVTRLSLYA